MGGSADLASPPLAMGVMARRNVVLDLTMVILLSMVICLMHVSMDLVLLDTQEEQPPMLLDQAQELASVVLMLNHMVSMDLFITVCLLTLSEELTRSMPVVDTLSNMCPWAKEVPNLLSRTIPMLLPMLLF